MIKVQDYVVTMLGDYWLNNVAIKRNRTINANTFFPRCR